MAYTWQMAPELLEIKAKDGSCFRCSESFLRKWLHDTVRWSPRKPTKAGHKLPVDWEALCSKAFYQISYSIWYYNIPSCLYVNSDQTQMLFSLGGRLTWAEMGSNQVAMIDIEDKRAATLVISVANNGNLLPFQVIYQGKMAASHPSPSS